MESPHIPFMRDSFPSAYKDSNEVDVGSSYLPDPALCLNSLYPDSGERKRKCDDEELCCDKDISLNLELGGLGSAREVREHRPVDVSLDFNLCFGGKKACKEVRSASPCTSSPKERPLIDLELCLSAGAAESDITSITLASSLVQNGISGISHIVDDGSTSSKWKKGPVTPLFDVLQNIEVNSKNVNPISIVSPPSVCVQTASIQAPKSSEDSDASREKEKPPRKSNVKTCQFPGCEKGARGASGRCISHGGGRRCQRLDCPKGAEGRTAFCKAHGGGRRCEHLGCTKSAEGRTDLCIAHGGGRRCTFAGGCNRAARGRSGLCIRHGGGKRCKIENCTKSAEGLSGLCIAHGGGRRCEYSGCTKGAQGSTKFCKAHGGGKRCTFLGCTKGAEGSTPFCKAHGGGKRCTFQGGGICTKSVHGGTLFCVSHGGGKRCAAPGCTKSARGRTSFCVRHGGGKRCKFEGCGKSAQGSTDFCKAHGGGKRCLWGQPGSGYGGDGESPCDKYGRGKVGLCAAHAAQVEDKRVHGNGTVGSKMKEIVTGGSLDLPDSNVVEGDLTLWNGFNLEQLDSVPRAGKKQLVGEDGEPSTSAALPEGRVHGGGLMALLRGGAPTWI